MELVAYTLKFTSLQILSVEHDIMKVNHRLSVVDI